jgi:hypothetical protein
MALDPDRHESERRKSLEPYESRTPTVRASDADRERTVAQLRQHLADGRLAMEEFSDRVDEAYQAKTTADLQVVLRELPHVQVRDPASPEQRAQANALERKRKRELRNSIASYVIVNSFLVAIWLVTSLASGEILFFWPIFPLLGWGIGVASQAWKVYGDRDDD